MLDCAACGLLGCRGPGGKYPEVCPTGHPTPAQVAALAEARERYEDPRVRAMAQSAAYIEKAGYCQWTRLEETVELARTMGYHHLGIACCNGLRREARVVERYFQDCGFDVSVAICKAGCVAKEEIGVPEAAQFQPGGRESMCNSIGQAYLLAAEGCDFSVLMGLCVGHDTLFLEHSFRKGVPATVLIAKDRVTGHNPAAAVYGAEGYFKARLDSHIKAK